MYRARRLSLEVLPVVANKVTEKSVWIRGKQQARISKIYCYFDSAQEAYDFLIKEYENAVESSKRRTEHLQKDLDTLRKETAKYVSLEESE
jgi:hypothetical protein